MVFPLLPLVLAVGVQAPPPQAPPPAPPATATAAAPAARAPRKVYNETADARTQIATAIATAAADDIRVLINWGANDDDRCAKFQQVQRAAEIAGPKFLSDEYKLVYVDVGHADKNLDVAAEWGARPKAGALPYFTVLDGTGKVLSGVPASDFAGADPAAFDAKKVAAFLAMHKAAAPDADPPFEAALSRAKKDGKYVFLWFSAPW